MNIRYPIYEGVYRILTMNRWNCRPKQKRGKSKRAERSIGFSPLIPAKQVHTGGNPFFISVTDIHTVSFGNNLLYLLAGYILL